MAKELPYFRFTPQEWQNGDISLERFELRGFFIDLCSYYWINDCSIAKAKLDKRYNNDIGLLDELISLDIILWDEETDFIQINFLNEQFDILSEQRKRRQRAGSMGGKQKSSNAKAKPNQSSSYKDKYKEKDNNKDKELNKVNRRNFIPPTTDQVKAYCSERKNNVDANRFIDHYTSNGWLVGKNKMKDWKAAVRTWEKNTVNKNINNNGTRNQQHPTRAQNAAIGLAKDMAEIHLRETGERIPYEQFLGGGN